MPGAGLMMQYDAQKKSAVIAYLYFGSSRDRSARTDSTLGKQDRP